VQFLNSRLKAHGQPLRNPGPNIVTPPQKFFSEFNDTKPAQAYLDIKKTCMQTQNSLTGFLVQPPQGSAEDLFAVPPFIHLLTLSAIAFLDRHSFSGGGSDGGFSRDTGPGHFISENRLIFRSAVSFDIKATISAYCVATSGLQTVSFVSEHINLINCNKNLKPYGRQSDHQRRLS
jgi:hypothetical protein